MNKNIAIALLLGTFVVAAQDRPAKTYHHCTHVGGSGNTPQLFDVSEVYQCDEGKIEIAGRMEMEIEHGYVYQSDLGRPSCERPHPVSEADYKNYKWCPDPGPQDLHQQRMCGDKPNTCFDGKTATWDEKWHGYSCATPDHK